MKFACPKCNTRYSISDDKVPAGKVLKFPCKTCGNVVRLRRKDGDQAQILDAALPAAAPSPQDPIETTRIASVAEINKLRNAAQPTRIDMKAAPAREEEGPLLGTPGLGRDEGGEATRIVGVDQINLLRAAAAETDPVFEEESEAPAKADGKSEPSEWFVLIAGKQRGPMTAAAVEAMLAKSEIDKRTFVWKSGMPNWERLGGVDHFSGAGAAAPAPAPAPEPVGAHSFIDEDGEDATVSDDHGSRDIADELGLGDLDEVTSGVFEENPLNGRPAAAASSRNDVTVTDDEPGGFYKANTMVVNDPRAFTASMNKPADDPRRAPTMALDEDALLGGFTAKSAEESSAASRPTDALVGTDAQIEESIASLGDASFDDDSRPLSVPGERSGLENIDQDPTYLDAPPGDSTKLYMEAGGIYKKRRNNRIAAVITGVVMLLVAVFIFMDMRGVIVLPGMGAVYDVAGVDDPNVDRALERTENKLAAEDLDPKKRAQLESLRRKLLDKSNQAVGTESRLDKRKSAIENKDDAGATTKEKEGVPEEKAPDDQHAMAEQLFNDARKQETDVKLATPGSIQTPNLPEGLTQEAIYKVVNDNNTSMKLCYAEAARKGEKLAGKMEVQLTIDASGDVTGADINTVQFKSSAMGQCTVRRVKTWKFPRFNGQPVTVVFPYVLQSAF